MFNIGIFETSDILSDEKHCPKEMCQVIYNVNQNNDVVIKDNTNNIKCDFTNLYLQLHQLQVLGQLQVLFL